MSSAIPLVSFLMPVYNAESTLKAALDSVLNQDYPSLEFVCVDDGSTDHSLEILELYKDPRIKIVRHAKNKGLPSALNSGLSEAQGKYIARMDADDLSVSDRVTKQVNFFEANPTIDILSSFVQTFGEGQTKVICPALKHPEILSECFFDTPLAHPSVMLRAETFRRLNILYDANYGYGIEDWELWSRICSQVQFECLPEILLKYRVTQNNISRTNSPGKLSLLGTIDRRNLSKIKIDPTPRQLQIHRNFSFGRPVFSPVSLIEYRDWIQNLSENQLKFSVFDNFQFSKSLFKRWVSLLGFVDESPIQKWMAHRALVNAGVFDEPMSLRQILRAAFRPYLAGVLSK